MGSQSSLYRHEINRGFFNLLCNRSAVDFIRNFGSFQPRLISTAPGVDFNRSMN
jgi:hypothetical protein